MQQSFLELTWWTVGLIGNQGSTPLKTTMSTFTITKQSCWFLPYSAINESCCHMKEGQTSNDGHSRKNMGRKEEEFGRLDVWTGWQAPPRGSHLYFPAGNKRNFTLPCLQCPCFIYCLYVLTGVPIFLGIWPYSDLFQSYRHEAMPLIVSLLLLLTSLTHLLLSVL